MAAYPPPNSLPITWQLTHHTTDCQPPDRLPTTQQLITSQLTHHMIAYPPPDNFMLTHHVTPYPPHDSLPTTWWLTHQMTSYSPHGCLPITQQLTHHTTAYPLWNSLPTTQQLAHNGTAYPPHDSLLPNLTWPLNHQIPVYPSHHSSAFHKFTSINTTWDHPKIARREQWQFDEWHSRGEIDEGARRGQYGLGANLHSNGQHLLNSRMNLCSATVCCYQLLHLFK